VFVRSSLAAVTVGLLFATAGCAGSASAAFGSDVDGHAVERAIDTKIMPSIRSQEPNLTIAPSVCADALDVSNGKIAHCTVSIDGVPIPIRVVYNGPPDDFKADLDGRLFPMADVERMEDRVLLKSYGVTARVSCGKPIVRLYRSGSDFRCAVTGSPKVTRLHLRATPLGIFTYNPPGLKPPVRRH
jgi:hypothetical protein